MHDMVCIVTGGRVRIGYCVVVKLLRAGAFVLTTTRFPADAVMRYTKEPDFASWKDRLEICGPLELTDLRSVEAFCDSITRSTSRPSRPASGELTRRNGCERACQSPHSDNLPAARDDGEPTTRSARRRPSSARTAEDRSDLTSPVVPVATCVPAFR